jgi:hypothetical protein
VSRADQALAIVLIAAPADQEVADRIATELAPLGVRGGPGGFEGDDVVAVVVLSAAATEDPGWRDLADRYGRGRCIPVQVGPVRNELVPEAIRPINYIPWAADRPIESLAMIFAAVTAPVQRLALHRDLTRQAEAWHAAGRPKDRLLGSVDRAREALEHLSDADSNVLTRPTKTLREFAVASAQHAKWRRYRFRAVVSALVAVVAATTLAATYAFVTLQIREMNHRLTSLLATSPDLSGHRPDLISLLGAAAVLQGNEVEAAIGRDLLLRGLEAHWPTSVVGSAHDSLIYDAVGVHDGAGILTIDTVGTLTLWDTATATVSWRRTVAGPGYHLLDATPDGRFIVIADGTQVHLVATDVWSRTTVHLDQRVIRLAYARAAQEVIAGVVDGALLAIGVDPPHAVREVSADSRAIDLRRTADGGVRALVPVGTDELALLDAVTGSVIGEFDAAFRVFSPRGSVGSDGRTVAFVDASQQVLYGEVGSDLRPIGHRVPEIIDDVLVLADDRIVVVSQQHGVELLDSRTGIRLAHLQAGAAGVARVRPLSGEDQLVGLDRFVVTQWSLTGLGPVTGPGGPDDPAVPEGTPVAEGGGVVVTGGRGGAVEIKSKHGSRVVSAVDGTVTTLAVAADATTVLIGSDIGQVTQVEVATGTLLRRWWSPDGSPVTWLDWAEEPGRLLVRTGSDAWWKPESCDACTTDEGLLAIVRQRALGCYVDENVVAMASRTREALGLRICSPSPPAVEG